MLSALLDHLWQSSLFAVGVGILTFMLRRNSASVRFGLWFSASVKFLVPFALLSELGSHIPRYTPALNAVNGAYCLGTAIHGITSPMAGLSRVIGPEPALSAPGHPVLSILGILWACGVVALGVYWFIGWRRNPTRARGIRTREYRLSNPSKNFRGDARACRRGHRADLTWCRTELRNGCLRGSCEPFWRTSAAMLGDGII